jgi:hypothetical protein
MKTGLLMVAGLFGLFAYFAGVQGQFSLCAVATVVSMGVLWMYFRSASTS